MAQLLLKMSVFLKNIYLFHAYTVNQKELACGNHIQGYIQHWQFYYLFWYIVILNFILQY